MTFRIWICQKESSYLLPKTISALNSPIWIMRCLMPISMSISWKGMIRNWLKQTGVNEVSYKDLPGGHYIFKLRVPGDENQMQTVDVMSENHIPSWQAYCLSLS